jgi:putative transcriptional regulator
MTDQDDKNRDIGAEILEGMEQAVSFLKGNNVRPVRVHQVDIPDELDVDVKGIREDLGLSQKDFASAYGFSVHTLRKWEQRVRTPQKPARFLLLMIRDMPEVVNRYLSQLSDNGPQGVRV